LSLFWIDKLDQYRAAIHLAALIGSKHREHIADSGKSLQIGFKLLHELGGTFQRRAGREPDRDFKGALIVLRQEVFTDEHEKRDGAKEDNHR
jgi:hypothetical protein